MSQTMIQRLANRLRRHYYRRRAQPARAHALLAQTELAGGLRLRQIAAEQTQTVFRDGTDHGYHGYGTQWWTNPACPLAFNYLALDAMYAPEYFDASRGHPSHAESAKLYDYMQQVHGTLFGRPFTSVLELGTGGGEITRHFHENALDHVAVEGTAAGVEKLRALGVPASRIQHRNLKFMRRLERRFELVMCTEVAEHIEPWFASKVVENCIVHADAVWFSAARGDVPPHYHHVNEAPIEAWDNLFAHCGFQHHVVLDGTMGRADRLYLNAEAAARLTGR